MIVINILLLVLQFGKFFIFSCSELFLLGISCSFKFTNTFEYSNMYVTKFN